jgi:hypothetical protein
MTYTAKERQYYNENRARICDKLGITKNQYNWLRRKGEALHKVYENSCNGVIAEDAYDLRTGDLEKEVRDYLLKQKLYRTGNQKVYFVYFQTDPRGATIYLDNKEIPDNSYTQANCIY